MRSRFLLVVVGVVALVLAVHDIPLASHLEAVERDRLVAGLERDAFLIGGRCENALAAGTASEEPELNALVRRYGRDEDVRVVVVDRSAVGVVGSDDAVLAEDFSNRPEIRSALGGTLTTGDRFSETLGYDLFYVSVPVWSGSEIVGAVRLTAPEEVVADRAAARVRGLLAVASISLLIAVAVAWWLANSITRPIRRLGAVTEDLAGGRLGARADDAHGPPEIRSLAGSFNSMASRLGQLVDRQRAFAGTASHQLRTPLTALRLRLEQLGEMVADDPAATSVLDDALAETDRLRRMIEGLLALTRAEDAAVGPVEVDLAALVRNRVEHWQPLADEGDVELVVRVPHDLVVLAIDGAVEQIIDNLVDNALEVSPPGSTLRLEVETAGAVAELHVVDEGPGLSAAERERAFERFWRGDRSAPDGSGLGLAIVHQLAAAGDGSAELRAAPGGGLDAVVCFRVAAPR
ncbi:MAG TPA: ATP-binding protein [Ilumatobacter sp.]